MQRITPRISQTVALVMAGLLIAGPVHADKPSWGGGNQGGKERQKDKHESFERSRNQRPDRNWRAGDSVNRNGYFLDRHRTVIHDYYVQRYRAGHCPPGLVKKGNSCMPRGQVKKWRIGRPLPREVIFHDLPPALVWSLNPAPAGHRYVRVAADILLITIGTGMVVDAIQDLGRMQR
jgi:Ni/Co efflux regulator RcnB